MKTNHLLYTRCITLKRVTNMRRPSARHCAPNNVASFEQMLQRWRAVADSMSDLTGPRFEPRTSRSRDDCIIPLDSKAGLR